MKIILKIIGYILLLGTLLVAGGLGYLYYLDSNLPREFRSESTFEGHTFTIVFEGPSMSFGSGHKVLILKDSATGRDIDELYFGEHPLTIKGINSRKIELIIPNSDYARDWCKTSNSIGDYAIKCLYE